MRRRTKWYAAVVGLATTGAVVLSSGGAAGHGYTDLPVSRQKLCQNGTMANCGWNQDHNLARSDLDLTPFLTAPYNGQRPPSILSHSGTLPSGLSGRHVIVAVWTIADTANAFYACSDVMF